MSQPVMPKQSWKSLLPSVYGWLDQVKVGEAKGLQSDAVHVVPVYTADAKKTLEFKSKHLDTATKDALLQGSNACGWQGKGNFLNLLVDGKAFLLLPVCKIKTSAIQIGRQFGLDAAKILKECKVSQVVFCDGPELENSDMLDGFATGLYNLGLFKNLKQKTPKTDNDLPVKVSFLHSTLNEKDWRKLKAYLKASCVTRMLQDSPPNWLNPIRFGDVAAELCKEAGIKCKLLGREDMDELGMGSFLSVAQGSPIEPRLIAIEVEGENNDKAIALIGKGLTFDTGGNSIKPSLGMGEMKYDMSGGAAVLGTALFLAEIKPPTKVVCLIGAVENMPGGTATRPGDIVSAMNGKTIDILNTDAEGRLVLCDLLHYANVTYKPEVMIDIATLTGAVLHALGTAGAAVLTNDDDVRDMVLNASKATGEPFWQLPFWPELDKEVKSDVADLQNIAKPNISAGTIMGGIFLKEFVGDTKWAHLDIAGTGWNCKATGYPAAGGSGYGVRTMAELCLRYES